MTKLGRYEEDRATDLARLKAAGAHVYSEEFTERYMQEQLLLHPPGLITRRMGAPWADTFKFFATAAAALASLVLIQEDMIPFLGYLENDLLLLGAKCLLAVSGFAAAHTLLSRTWCRPPSDWRTYRLEDDGTYVVFGSPFKEQRVPEFVQSLLLSIRQVLPESSLGIVVLGLDPIITCTTPRGIYTVLIYDGDTTVHES